MCCICPQAVALGHASEFSVPGVLKSGQSMTPTTGPVQGAHYSWLWALSLSLGFFDQCWGWGRIERGRKSDPLN